MNQTLTVSPKVSGRTQFLTTVYLRQAIRFPGSVRKTNTTHPKGVVTKPRPDSHCLSMAGRDLGRLQDTKFPSPSGWLPKKPQAECPDDVCDFLRGHSPATKPAALRASMQPEPHQGRPTMDEKGAPGDRDPLAGCSHNLCGVCTHECVSHLHHV